MAYATAAEYEAWTGETAPDDIERRLTVASEIIDRSVFVVYDPLDVGAEEALRSATLEQVSTNPDLPYGVGTKSVAGGFQTVKDGSPDPRSEIVPAAENFLRNAGLTYAAVESL